jgi:hypothetical protein
MLLAAAFHGGLGAAFIVWPHQFSMGPPNQPEIWQGMGQQWSGLMLLALGVGFLAASTNPVRHWPVALIGFLSNAGPAGGLLLADSAGSWPWSFGRIIATADIVWLLFFSAILWKAYQSRQGIIRQISPAVQEMALRSRTNKGVTLLEMSKRQPILVVFLRHFGCPFCRETLSDLSQQRKEIEAAGTQIVLIHMAPDQQAHDVFLFYGLSDLPRVSDHGRLVYRAFGLGPGGLLRIFGPLAVWRFLSEGIFYRHGLGWILGDGFQMPGIFVVFQGHIVRSFLHRSVADRPNYRRMVQLGVDDGSDAAVAS